MSISSLYNEISMYNNLKFKITNIIYNLNKSAENLFPVPDTIINLYSVDEKPTPLVNKSKQLYDEIISTSNYLSQTIIPAIDNMIRIKQNQINVLEINNQ